MSNYFHDPILALWPVARLLFFGLAGYLIFGDFPDRLTLVGAAIIVACGLYIAHRESVVRRAGRIGRGPPGAT